MRKLFIIILVALVPLMALDAGGAELRPDKKAKTTKVDKKKKGKVKKVVVGVGTNDPDFIDDSLMNGLPGKYSIEDLQDGGDMCYNNVDVEPVYPGGIQALMQDVANNLKYPEEAIKNKTEGRVLVQFVVEKDGSIGLIKVAQSLSPECDQAAIEAVKKLKSFTPGLVEEKPVRVWYTLPINYKYTGTAEQPEKDYELVKVWDPDREVFRDPYSMPFYPGGDKALLQDLAENLVYPAEAVKEGVQGRTILQFVIKTDGSIDDIKVVQSLSPECDQAAIEAVKKLKRFKPGLKDAKPVNVKYTLPVSFKLPE